MNYEGLKKANNLVLEGKYKDAIACYLDVTRTNPELSDMINFNINFCHRKLNTSSKKALFISHDASLTGAPGVLVEIIKWANINDNVDPFIIYGGTHDDRVNEFNDLGPCLHVKDAARQSKAEIMKFLENHDFEYVYVNSVASAKIFQIVYSVLNGKTKFIGHVHEKEGVINHFKSEAKFIANYCDKIIIVSPEVELILRNMGDRRIPIMFAPPFIKEFEGEKDILAYDDPVIFGCGTIEPRKGFDLFCAAIDKLSRQTNRRFQAAWIGPSSMDEEPRQSLVKYSLDGFVKILGKHENPRVLYKKGDIFFLSSREEPFSLAAIEAAEQGLAILSFDGSASPGMDTFIRKYGAGLIARYLDVDDAAHCLQLLLDHPDMKNNMGDNGSKAVISDYYSKSIMPSINAFINQLNKSKKNLKVLVISLGPVPVLGLKIMEGGGLRSWGLARGIADSGFDVDVSLTFPKWYIELNEGKVVQKVNVFTWNDENHLVDLSKCFDVVIVSYCFGGPTTSVVNNIRPDQILILDCYVPIHAEVCARNSEDLIGEDQSFGGDSAHWDGALVRGDYLLCASEQQKNYYIGLLYGLKHIDPISYAKSDNIIIAPFGIDDHPIVISGRKPITEIVKQGAFKLLWFGGVYPWFNIDDLIMSVGILRSRGLNVELIIVGAKNPFNNHPDFVTIAYNIIAMAESEDYKYFTHIVDWVPYDQRFEWYKDADLIVTFNKIGIENGLSWRTRIADYLMCESIFVTNGGDPLSDKLIDAGLGFRITNSTVDDLADNMLSVINRVIELSLNGSSIVDREMISHIKSDLYWRQIGFSIIDRIVSNANPG
ncbi:glycosyltransferase [Acidithiobacillus ferriphilus]|uniref:glycosyltransferase family 4 protein n=1 Tax=Acidithiobacillus ferriphilus TaxID=1689834 RepID=UPI00390C4A9B